MRKIHKTVLSAIISMSVALQLNAQSTANESIIPNGGFEEWQNSEEPVGWRIASTFAPEQVEESRPDGSGTYALKIWANGGFIYQAQPVEVKEGKKYTFSFWYKGNKANNQIRVNLLWYNDNAPEGKEQISVKTAAGEWKKAEHTITIPGEIDGVKISLSPGSYNDVYILLDDISMIPQEDVPSPEPALEAPKNLNIKAYQSEMEISWNKVTDKEVKWEVMFDGKIETTTSQNSYMKTKLKPGSEHQVKVRAIKGKEFSPYVEKKGTTEDMREAENSENRIPYLRTISADGNCEGRFLHLYYNELVNPNAKITYKLNGITIDPKENILEFPEFEGFYKQFQLEVYIDEGEGREWEILYPQLGIKKIEE